MNFNSLYGSIDERTNPLYLPSIIMQCFFIYRFFHNRYNKHYKILLDIGEYKEEKYEKLIQMARRYAKEVQQTKGKVTLKPMPSDERRIIHGALTNYHNIKTESVGQGKDRRLTIYYVEE